MRSIQKELPSVLERARRAAEQGDEAALVQLAEQYRHTPIEAEAPIARAELFIAEGKAEEAKRVAQKSGKRK